MKYDKTSDRLTIVLGTAISECYDFEGGDFTVTVDEGNEIVSISIESASRFVARALAAGIEIHDAPKARSSKRGMVWHDADSSMISAFGYDEAEQILEVAFHRTGVYRYFEVPPEVFEGLCNASSKGSYMRGQIIDMYPYEKKRGRR